LGARFCCPGAADASLTALRLVPFMPHLLRSGSFLASRCAAFGLASLGQCVERCRAGSVPLGQLFLTSEGET
jgi:hypothetical protein